MLSLFRHLPSFHKHVALVVALVFFLLATTGEAFHYKHHAGPRSQTAITGQSVSLRNAPLPALEAPDSYCALCEWEKTPAAQPSMFAPPTFFVLFSLLRAGFVEKPLFFVRQTLALRESRGPPFLAFS